MRALPSHRAPLGACFLGACSLLATLSLDAALLASRGEAPASPGEALASSNETGEAAETSMPDVSELLRGFDELYESTGTRAQMEMSIRRPNKTRTLRTRMWGKGDDRALIVIDAPSRDAGTATLKVDDNLWNYLPKISRTIRVPPSMMMGSWMGSDLTNDDLVRETSYEEDYLSELMGRSEDPPGWKVSLVARPDVVGLWNRVEVVFSYEDEIPVQAQYFDRKDRLARTMRLEDITDIGNRHVPTRITVIAEREDGHATEMRYLEVEFDVEVDDSMFSLSQLERRH